MDKKSIKFGNTETEKHKFHQLKSSVLINNIDNNKIVVSNKVSFTKKSFKFFIVTKMVKKLDLYPFGFQK